MARSYLGERLVRRPSPFDMIERERWALEFIVRYGQVDGAHHKQWVLDQVARVLLGTQVEVYEARWSDGATEERIRLSETPSSKYLAWVKEQRAGEDGPETYDYDVGVAP